MRAPRGLGRWLLLAGGLAASVACGQEAPDDPVGGGGLQPYFPLVAGSWWDYHHTSRGGWDERVTAEAADFDGAPAFLVTDSPTSGDNIRSDSILRVVDGRAVRVSKEEYFIGTDNSATLQSSVTYGVGFTRFNEDWANQAVGYRETPEYERVETRADGSMRAPEARRHTFEIVSLAEDVDTPKGTLSCIVIRRTKDWEAEEEGIDAEDAEAKQFWFARGVGKVQELNLDSNNVETITDWLIPTP